jgi:hypothetical protein
MMYRNVTRAHDYFKAAHGVDWLDFPLPAIVNLQFKITPPIPLGDFRPGPNGWYDFPNAAYFPKESWDALAGQLGLPGRDTDSIIFGQAGHDFSYDASVIMHEYTHAVIGTDRLGGRVLDAYGLDDSPRAMNEGLADYFAASVADAPVVGEYGIGKLAPNLVRDLSVSRRCPDDLVNEIHADGASSPPRPGRFVRPSAPRRPIASCSRPSRSSARRRTSRRPVSCSWPPRRTWTRRRSRRSARS